MQTCLETITTKIIDVVADIVFNVIPCDAVNLASQVMACWKQEGGTMDALLAVHPRLSGLKIALQSLGRVTTFLHLRTRYAIDLFKDVIKILGPSVCAAHVNGLLEKIVLLASACEVEVSDEDTRCSDAAAWVALWQRVAGKAASEAMPKIFLLTPEQAQAHAIRSTRVNASKTLAELRMAASLFSIEASQEATKKQIISDIVAKEVAMAQDATSAFLDSIDFSDAPVGVTNEQADEVESPNKVASLEADPGDYISVADRIGTSKSAIRATMIMHAASTATTAKVEAIGKGFY